MGIEFKDFSDDIKRKLEEALIAGLYEAAGEIESQTVQNAKRYSDSGQTRNAWAYYVDEGKMTATIGNPLENSLWEEFGTGAWAEGGKGRKDAWYVPVDGYTGNKRPTYNGKVVIVYGKNKKKFYKTNGKKPRRHFQLAFNQKKQITIQLIQNKLKDALK